MNSRQKHANPKEEILESEARKELRKLVEYASTITKDMIGATSHIEERWKNFTSGLESSKNVLNNANSTDEEINNSIIMLKYFIEELYISNNGGSQAPESEAKKELRKLVEYASTITEDMIGATSHIEERWGNFTNGLESAKNVLNNVNSTDEEINNSIIMLNYFISELYISNK